MANTNKAKAQYNCSFTPIEIYYYDVADKLTGTGTNLISEVVKSTNGSAAIGGGMSGISPSAGGHVVTTTTVAGVEGDLSTGEIDIDDIGDGSITNSKALHFLAVRIKGNVSGGSVADADMRCDVLIDGSAVAVRLEGKGACVCLPMDGTTNTTASVELKGTADKLCTVQVQVVHAA